MRISNILFPPRCISCQKLTRSRNDFYKYLCESCLKKITLQEENYCFRCHNLTRYGNICAKCKDKSPLQGIVVAAPYQNPILKESIHYLKYHRLKELSLPLSWLMVEKLEGFPWQKRKNWIIIPVPLAKRRLKDRGFNQAELLARNIAKWLNISFSSAIIERIKFCVPQMEVHDRRERKANVLNSFRIKKSFNPALLKGKKIMLIDDVSTTGATLEECAKVLRVHIREIWGCVIAK